MPCVYNTLTNKRRIKGLHMVLLYHHSLFCSIYTILVSLIFGTASFNILSDKAYTHHKMKWMVLIVELLWSPWCILLSGSGSGFIVLKVCLCCLKLPLHSACGGRLAKSSLIWDYEGLGVLSSQNCDFITPFYEEVFHLQL